MTKAQQRRQRKLDVQAAAYRRALAESRALADLARTAHHPDVADMYRANADRIRRSVAHLEASR